MAPRLFLIEDDKVVIGIVRDGAAAQGWEFSFHPMFTGAFEALKNSGADALLLDLSLPGGDGLDICRSVKADSALRALPVIILTSKDGLDDRLKGFEAGAQDYVAKPFSPPEVFARVRAHLAIKSREAELESKLVQDRLDDRVRQDVTDMIVHDLKSPLTTVKVTLDLIAQSHLIEKPPYERFVGYAKDSLEYALLMINDLLDLGAGKLKVVSAPVDFAQLASRLERFTGLQFRERKINLIFDFPAGGSGMESDVSLLFRILVNLMTNALKFSSQGDTVAVRGRVIPKGLRLEVDDCGPGIPDAEKEAVFEKYYRASNVNAQSIAGSGIGLAFCRLAATALGGKIWIEDVKPHGCRFVIEVAGAPSPKAAS